MDSFFYFGQGDEPLFGALHLPSGEAGGRTVGAVVCAPLGYDNLASYRPLRILAQRIADEAGRPTLRFDWPGAGDSAGESTDDGLVERWLDTVAAVVAELRARTGVEQVALVGAGIGATLAALGAARATAVDELVLWAPPLTGRAYMRELRAFHAFSESNTGTPAREPPSLPAGSFEATGAFFSPETTRDLGVLDLVGADLGTSGVERALVFGRDGEEAAPQLLASLLEAGIEATSATGDGLDLLVNDVTKLPSDTFDRIVSWLDGGGRRASRPIGSPTGTVRAVAATGVDETIVTLQSADGRLVGVEAIPAESAEQMPTWVVFPTTGVLRRAGPNRFWTTFARELARRGVPSLRIDVHGVGDSDGPETTTTTLETEYSSEVVRSVRTALAHLRESRGATRFVLVGLCSGAFSSFQTALVDTDVAGAMMVNPPTLFWTHEDEVRAQSTYLRESVLRMDRWQRALRGKVNIIRVAAVMGRVTASTVRRHANQLRRPAVRAARDTVGDAIVQALDHLEQRAVPVLVVYADPDPGLEYLERHLDTGVDVLRARPNVRVETVQGAGHTFNPLWSHDVLRDLLYEHLGRCEALAEAAPTAR